MSNPMPAPAVLDREFLEMRAKILELAASLDRLERGDGDVKTDPRFQLLQQGLNLLLESETGRAERTQLLFSLPFTEEWRTEMQV